MSIYELDWDHVYLLGWYDWFGRVLTTTYENRNNYETICVVVTGPHIRNFGPPIWGYTRNSMKIPVNMFQIHEIPHGTTREEYARELHGVVAFGWYIPGGFERISHTEDEPGVQKIPGWHIEVD